jgi:mannose-6-phosphate isomerase
MGTHPSSPSRISLDSSTANKPLVDHLRDQPHLLGDKVSRAFYAQRGNLPFLLKVLSIQKALSIQVHPDKPTAERLHAEKPDIYRGMQSVFLPETNRRD